MGASKEQILWGKNDDPNIKLTKGSEYEIEDTKFYSWRTQIKLRGIDGWFNDASFVHILKEEVCDRKI